MHRLSPRRALGARSLASAAFLLPAVAALLVYFPFLNDYFATDDFHWLAAASKPDALDFLKQAFTFPEATEFAYATPNWRPLVDVYFFVTYRLFGLDPFPYHLVNVLLHGATACLLAVLIAALTSRPAIGVVAGLLFAVSPTYDLVVNSIGHATELFASFFSFLALVLYLGYLQRRNRASILYALALASFGLALMSRESSFTLVVVLLGMALVSKRPASLTESRAVLIPTLPFAALAGVFVVFGYLAQYRDAAQFGFYEVGWHGFDNLRAYLKWIILPLPWHWGEWLEEAQRWAALGLVAAGAVALAMRRWLLVWLFGWLVVALLPFLFIREGIELRYTYLATAPLAALLSIAGYEVVSVVKLRPAAVPASAGVFALLVLLVFLGGRARDQQTWFRQQSANYESVVVNATSLCGELPPRAHLVLLNSPAFDPYGMNVSSALNLFYDRLYVHAVTPGEELLILAEATTACVVEYRAGEWERR
jgi:hypothetical protein